MLRAIENTGGNSTCRECVPRAGEPVQKVFSIIRSSNGKIKSEFGAVMKRMLGNLSIRRNRLSLRKVYHLARI